MTKHPAIVEDEIKARAASLGFSLCGITSPEPLANYQKYVSWIGRGLHADMRYMASPYHMEMRRDPKLLLPGVRSVIVLGFPYPLHPVEILDHPNIGLVSGYATGADYHDLIPRRLATLVDFISTIDSSSRAATVYTDSAPILERELAVRAGLGWIGRNSCLVSPSQGSNVLLAEIFTCVQLSADQPFTADRCGSCERCVKACPVNCILPDRTVDANLCLSYHIIEIKGNIPQPVMEKFGSWIFGCDICQMVCPWNHRSRMEPNHLQKPMSLSLEEMIVFLESTPADFQTLYGMTAVARVKWSGLARNILIRLANMQGRNSIDSIRKFTCSDQPTLQQTAVWALAKLASEQ